MLRIKKKVRLQIGVFPTSLCGVLVFRLDPAALLRPPPRRLTHSLSLSHLPHLTHHISITITTPLLTSHSSLRLRRWPAAASCVAGAVHRASWRSCGARGRRWPAAASCVAGASWWSCGARGRRWPAAAFCVAGAVHRASWRSCGARGRRWPAAASCVAGAAHRASWRSCGADGRRWPAAASCVAGAVHRASW